jgi:pimeloyl-ACP methyl ester carboxylesterase
MRQGRHRPSGASRLVGWLAGALLLVAILYAGLAGVSAAREGGPGTTPDYTSAGPVARPALDPPAGGPLAPDHPAVVAPGADYAFDDHFVHVPARLAAPARVLVVLHGMGGAGREMCDSVRAWSDREGWVVVGPTFAYGDWTDPSQVAREEPRLVPRLARILDELPARLGRPLDTRVVLFGFSRGGQVAERFALVYPERVRGVVVLAAGTYTLPLREAIVDGEAVPLRYPFGVADLAERFGRDLDLAALRQVPFWIGVGAADNQPGLPAPWTPYLGDGRVERARRFAAALEGLGITARVQEFPGVGHELSEGERDAALAFVRALP